MSRSEGDALSRAASDAAAGRLAAARQRLKGYLVVSPTSIPARRLLTEMYRAGGYPDEAGRWGYLLPDGASSREKELYERACAHRVNESWTYTYRRKGLHWPPRFPPPDQYAAEVLEGLDRMVAAESEQNRYRGVVERLMDLVEGR